MTDDIEEAEAPVAFEDAKASAEAILADPAHRNFKPEEEPREDDLMDPTLQAPE